MKVAFSDRGWEDYLHWQTEAPQELQRLNRVIEECRRTLSKGLAKPEPLRDDLKGWWSRRITSEHRLIYRVTGKAPDQLLEIIQCRFHY